MYNVATNFHTLSIQDAPNTRVRIYFIDSGVNCWDDNDVQTNGTLLVGAVGDTDSNGRIGQDGIKFTEYYNPEYNVTIGRAVSSQVEMTLMNTDGALNNFAYGRCKIYLDVYDSANSAWLPCPMGVYIIEQPTRRKSQIIHAFGYDQMSKLDEICDGWWASLDFSSGITLRNLIDYIAIVFNGPVTAGTYTTILNSSVTYTEPPFDCVETTYREVLARIAEATGTVARFDRDGVLDLKWFNPAQISGNTVQIDTDTVGNQCFAIDIAEYQSHAIDMLKVKNADDDSTVSIGSGLNKYTILDNLLLGRSSATITTRATPIYNRLNTFGAYVPIQSKMIWDWSIEAGDIIEIVRDSTTYSVPIFQSVMTWRGGYVVSEVGNTGDQKRPVSSYDERSSYRTQYGISANEINDKISQITGPITIQASEITLSGGVPDVVNRRCYATLSSAGWYRVLKTADVSGTIIDLYIGRPYGADAAETHKISLVENYNNISFANEISASNSMIVDKIRYMQSGSNAYVDIHYNVSTSNLVSVDFNVHTLASLQDDFDVSVALSKVADSPSGETELAKYNFAANTNVARTAYTPTFSGTANPSINNIACFYSIKDGVMYAGGRFNIASFTSGSTTVLFTLPVSLGIADRGAETIGTVFTASKTLQLRSYGADVYITDAAGNYSGGLLNTGYWSFQIVAPIYN